MIGKSKGAAMAAVPVADRKIGFEEFMEIAPESAIAEWVNGEIIVIAPPSIRHQQLTLFLAAILQYFAEWRSLGVVLPAPCLMKGPGQMPGREPDVLFVSNEHRDRIRENLLEGAADLVIEIISPDSRQRDRREKFLEYQQIGVAEYWIIDPAEREALFHHRGESGKFQPISTSEGIVRSVAMPGLWLRVDWLWQEPLPTLISVFREWGAA